MKLRIGSRMMAGFSIMSGLLLIIGIFALVYLNRLQEDNRKILGDNVSSLKAAEELEIALLDMKGLTSNYLLNGSEIWLIHFVDKKNTFEEWLNAARKWALSPGEAKIIGEIEALFEKYVHYHDEVIALYNDGQIKHAQDLLLNQMRSNFLEIYEKCEEYLFLNEQLMSVARQRIESEYQTAQLIIYGVAAIGILVGIFLGILIAKSIIKPIYELVLKIRGATEGELLEKVDIENETELDHLDRHIRRLIDRIYDINKDLEVSRKKLIQAEKLAVIGHLAAGIAHEIYNPLTSVKILLYSLQKELKLDAPKTNDFEVITKEIVRMERFVRNFLQYAHPNKTQKKFININDVIHDTLSLLTGQISNGQIGIEKTLLPDVPKVYADEEQLKQILINLVLNSLQAMPHGGKLKIETRLEKKIHQGSAPFLQIIIRDDGEGISPKILDNLFDPFVTTKSNGAGLGLFISYQIAKQHGGWIEGVNNPGSGATFTINLPL